MMGRNHVITGVCALEHLYVANELINRADISTLTAAQGIALSCLGVSQLAEPASLRTRILTVLLYLGMFFLGVLLPDIDNPKSMLGRFIRVPFRHRTWLHAIYLYLAFMVLGWW